MNSYQNLYQNADFVIQRNWKDWGVFCIENNTAIHRSHRSMLLEKRL